MFFPLAQEMLRQGGYVCGCVWNEQMDAVHVVSNKLEDVERMRSSKYVQSDIGNCLATVRGLLKAGTPVMFCGTPCQCAACAAVTGNPENLPNPSWHLAFNTAASFMTNTNWQAYSGESTLSYLTQALGLTVQNFVSAATGIAVLFALIRGFTKVKVDGHT